MKKILMTSTALCLLLNIGFSTEAFAQSLETAVRSSLEAHPSVDAAKAALQMTKEEKREAFSGYFPELSVNASAGRIYGDNATSRGLSVTRGAGYSYLGEGSITMTQLLFDGLETPSRVDAAKARQKSASASMMDVRENLALRAAQSYVDLIRAYRGLDQIRAHSNKVADYLGRINTMVDEGASDESELQQARDISIILKGIQSDFEGQVKAAEARYREVTGQDVPSELDDPLDVSAAIDPDVSKVMISALSEHPALKAAKMEAKATGYDVDAEQGTLFPDFNGELSYLKSDKDDLIGGEVTDARALVRMSWNFSTGGAQFARIRRSKYAENEARARFEELERQVEQNVRLAYSEYETAKDQLSLLKDRQALNRKLFSAYETQFEGARVNLLQLMQAHNQLFNTDLEALNGKYRYLAAQYTVLASLGQLQSAFNIQMDDQPAVQNAAYQPDDQQ